MSNMNLRISQESQPSPRAEERGQVRLRGDMTHAQTEHETNAQANRLRGNTTYSKERLRALHASGIQHEHRGPSRLLSHRLSPHTTCQQTPSHRSTTQSPQRRRHLLADTARSRSLQTQTHCLELLACCPYPGEHGAPKASIGGPWGPCMGRVAYNLVTLT